MNSSVALAQTTGSPSSAPDTPANTPTDAQAAPGNPDGSNALAGGGDQPWVEMSDFLRWQSLPYQDRQELRSREPQEWAKLTDFLKENCPNRATLLDRQSPPPGSPARARLLLRWENIQRLQHEQPDLYEVEIDQLKQEDVLIGLVARFRQAHAHQDRDRSMELWRQIEAESLKLVDLNLHERDLRLQNAQKLLANQQADLQHDEQYREQLAHSRARQFLQQIGAGRQFGGPNGRGGPPRDGTEDSSPAGLTPSPTAAGVAPATPSH
jgi:hypothetical protein